MKTTTLPPVRVHDDLRTAVEGVLAEGESLSSFIESSVRRAVEHRQVQTAFEARAEASWQDYQRTGISHPAAQVHAELRAMTAKRRAQLEKQKPARAQTAKP